jgi:hypothetical protein
MGRNRIKLKPAVEAEIEARTARGESARTIFSAIGKALSIATIERRQKDLKSKTGRASRLGAGRQLKAAVPAASAAPRPDSGGAALLKAYETPSDDITAAKRLLDLVVSDEPEIGEAIAEGSSLIEALEASPHGDALLCIRAPKDLADLVLRVTADHAPFGYALEPGESPEAFARSMAEITAAGRKRAVALLKVAHEIVRALTGAP